MDGADHSRGLGDGCGDGAVIFTGEDEGDLTRRNVKDVGDVLEGVVFADGVEGVVDFPPGHFGDGGLEIRDEFFVPLAVIEDDVAFFGGDEGFHEGDAAAGDAD